MLTLVPARLAPPISLSRYARQFVIRTIPESHTVPPIASSTTPLYIRLQNSADHPTVASQFVPPYSQADHHHTTAQANSNETRRHCDSNGSYNAMNMAKRCQNKDLNYIGADNEIIVDFIVQYNLV